MNLKTIKTAGIFGLMSLVLFSCRRDDLATIDENDAIEIISASITEDNDGLEEEGVDVENNNLFQSASQLGGTETKCGQTLNISRNFNRTVGARSFTYTATGTRDGICKNDTLIAFEFDIDFNTSFTGSNYFSTGVGSRIGRLDEVNSASTFWIWNGSGNRSTTGTYTTRKGKEITVTSELIFNSNINIDKATRKITSGLTNFNLTGISNGTNNFNYAGTIEYLGNRQAIITINGNAYTVNY